MAGLSLSSAPRGPPSHRSSSPVSWTDEDDSGKLDTVHLPNWIPSTENVLPKYATGVEKPDDRATKSRLSRMAQVKAKVKQGWRTFRSNKKRFVAFVVFLVLLTCGGVGAGVGVSVVNYKKHLALGYHDSYLAFIFGVIKRNEDMICARMPWTYNHIGRFLNITDLDDDIFSQFTYHRLHDDSSDAWYVVNGKPVFLSSNPPFRPDRYTLNGQYFEVWNAVDSWLAAGDDVRDIHGGKIKYDMNGVWGVSLEEHLVEVPAEIVVVVEELEG